jgi:hypothetical protein
LICFAPDKEGPRQVDQTPELQTLWQIRYAMGNKSKTCITGHAEAGSFKTMIKPRLPNGAKLDRIDMSEQVLNGWPVMLRLGATPAENLRLIENEIEALQALTDQPERRAGLIERYKDLGAGLRQDIN